MKSIIQISHLKIQNANALSSPYTIGFPAQTAWIGGMTALQRKLNTRYKNLKFKGIAVICHDFDLQTYKGHNDYVFSIIGTKNPSNEKGKSPSFVEEARCHLEVSILIEYEGISGEELENIIEEIKANLNSGLRFAGGDILSFKRVEIKKIEDEKSLRKVTRSVMPGFALIERRDLMVEAMKEGLDCIDALLKYLVIKNHCNKDEKDKVTWTKSREIKGWIVPIATGFHGISIIGKVNNQRDESVPHCFAESVVTLGEFIMPHRIESLDEILWHYSYKEEQKLYICQQNQNNRKEVFNG